MNIKDLQMIIAEIAHDANLTWGYKTNTVVDSTPYKHLLGSEKENKRYVVELVANCLITNPEMTPEDSHNLWLKTAPEGHPLNKAYAELTLEEKAKDVIFQGIIKIYLALFSLELETQKNKS